MMLNDHNSKTNCKSRLMATIKELITMREHAINYQILVYRVMLTIRAQGIKPSLDTVWNKSPPLSVEEKSKLHEEQSLQLFRSWLSRLILIKFYQNLYGSHLNKEPNKCLGFNWAKSTYTPPYIFSVVSTHLSNLANLDGRQSSRTSLSNI